MNVDRLKSLGWQYKVELKQGLELACQWFIENEAGFRA
jgi:GDP-L-fucose synthase